MRTYIRLSLTAGISCFAALLAFSQVPASTPLQEDIIKTSGGDLKITFIGHATLMFTYGGKVIHVDPISSATDYTKLPKSDLVLVAHEHGDHMDPKAIQLVSTEKTVVVASPTCAKALPAATILSNGETRTIAGFRVEAVAAYNLVNKRPDGTVYHPKGNGNGYVITFGDRKVYVAGDTENTPEMKSLKGIDIAFLPMNRPTMTLDMLVDAATALRPRILYVYHYSDNDPATVVERLKDEKGIEVRIRNLR